APTPKGACSPKESTRCGRSSKRLGPRTERIFVSGVRIYSNLCHVTFTRDILSPSMEQNPPPFPSPEELKSKIAEFMKSNFGDRVSFATFTSPEPAETTGEEKSVPVEGDEFAFNFLPRDIKAHLDRFVIKQEEAKKVLAIAVCDHYNHAKFLRQLEKEDPARADETEYAKQN